MSKQLKPNEWIYFFNLYEEDYFQWRIEYRISRGKLTKITITIFTIKMKKYKTLFNFRWYFFFYIFFQSSFLKNGLNLLILS